MRILWFFIREIIKTQNRNFSAYVEKEKEKKKKRKKKLPSHYINAMMLRIALKIKITGYAENEAPQSENFSISIKNIM